MSDDHPLHPEAVPPIRLAYDPVALLAANGFVSLEYWRRRVSFQHPSGQLVIGSCPSTAVNWERRIVLRLHGAGSLEGADCWTAHYRGMFGGPFDSLPEALAWPDTLDASFAASLETAEAQKRQQELQAANPRRGRSDVQLCDEPSQGKCPFCHLDCWRRGLLFPHELSACLSHAPATFFDFDSDDETDFG